MCHGLFWWMYLWMFACIRSTQWLLHVVSELVFFLGLGISFTFWHVAKPKNRRHNSQIIDNKSSERRANVNQCNLSTLHELIISVIFIVLYIFILWGTSAQTWGHLIASEHKPNLPEIEFIFRVNVFISI